MNLEYEVYLIESSMMQVYTRNTNCSDPSQTTGSYILFPEKLRQISKRLKKKPLKRKLVKKENLSKKPERPDQEK